MKSTIYGGIFDKEQLDVEIKSLTEKSLMSDFWDKPEEASFVLKNLKELQDESRMLDNFMTEIEFIEELVKEEGLEAVGSEIKSLAKKVQKVSFMKLLSGKNDKRGAIVEIHSGAGGTEATDWARMLFRMYSLYCRKKGFNFKVLYELRDEAGGFKTVVFEVNSKYAYGHLKSEIGVHRLVRFSPFDSSNKRHTSFASVSVYPLIDEDISININPSDIKVDTFRASGAGGQHVNTTDSAVRITHKPTGIVVTCQNERSQVNNREAALKLLKNKLYLLEEEKMEEEKNKNYANLSDVDFGRQIRSYVMCPYRLVKDNRTGIEESDVDGVLDGNIDEFIEEYLKWKK